MGRDFSILLYIYEQTEINKKNICFSNIAENNKYYSKNDVSLALDKLYDIRAIDINWAKIDGKYASYYSVSDDFKPFTKGLYNVTKEANNKKQSQISLAKEEKSGFSF